MLRRIALVFVVGVGLVACGGDDGGDPPFDRQAAIEFVMDSTKGTVGEKNAACLREFLDAQSDDALEQMATGRSRELTDAVVACVDG